MNNSNILDFLTEDQKLILNQSTITHSAVTHLINIGFNPLNVLRVVIEMGELLEKQRELIVLYKVDNRKSTS